jgi:hypothetical protein
VPQTAANAPQARLPFGAVVILWEPLFLCKMAFTRDVTPSAPGQASSEAPSGGAGSIRGMNLARLTAKTSAFMGYLSSMLLIDLGSQEDKGGAVARRLQDEVERLVRIAARSPDERRCSAAALNFAWREFWTEVARFISEKGSVSPTLLEGSTTFKQLCCLTDVLMEDVFPPEARGWALLTAFAAFGRDCKRNPKESYEHIFALLEWFIEEICRKKWGLANPIQLRGPLLEEEDNHCSPLDVAILYDDAALVRFALSKGASTDLVAPQLDEWVVHPIVFAFGRKSWNALEALLPHVSFDLKDIGSDEPVLMVLLLLFEERFSTDLERLAMLRRLFLLRPDALDVTGRPTCCYRPSLLEYVIIHCSPTLVDVVLQAGARSTFGGGEARAEAPADGDGNAFTGHKCHTLSTLRTALKYSEYPTIELLVNNYRLLDAWSKRYPAQELDALAKQFTVALVESIDKEDDLRQLLDLFLRREEPFVWEFLSSNGESPFWHRIISEGKSKLSSAQVLSLVQKLRAGGWDLSEVSRPVTTSTATAGGEDAETDTVALACIFAGFYEFIPFALTEFKCNVEASTRATLCCPETVIKHTLLTQAILRGRFELARQLIVDYGASVTYLSRSEIEQPLSVLLASVTGCTDEQTESLLRLLVEKDRTLLDLPCFRGPTSVMTHHQENLLFWPVSLYKKPLCVSFLLEANLPGMEALVTRPWIYKDCGMVVNQPQWCAWNGDWEMLELFLRHCPYLRVTERHSLAGYNSPTIFEAATKGANKSGRRAPRHLVAIVTARAKAEKERAKLTEAGGSGDLLRSNVTEDTSFKPVTSEKEEKKKAKKRAAKQKAKARKLAEKGLSPGKGAVAGGAGFDTDSSSGSEEIESEEEDVREDLVDSRNAPDLTVMLAARRAAREKEGEKRKAEGKGVER